MDIVVQVSVVPPGLLFSFFIHVTKYQIDSKYHKNIIVFFLFLMKNNQLFQIINLLHIQIINSLYQMVNLITTVMLKNYIF